MAKILHTPTKPIVMRPPDVLGPPHPLKPSYVPASGAPYQVKDGDDWHSVARMHGLDVKALIRFNFKTTASDHVNFYLQHITGCNKTYDDINWAFSSSASPGKIYIPVSKTIDADAGVVEGRFRDERDPYVRYGEIIPRIDGHPGKRLAKILHLINVVGKQDYRQLWYYDSYVVMRYLDKLTTDDHRRRFTLFTNGKLPFDGHATAGLNWKVYPFQRIMEVWARRYDLSPTDSQLAKELVDMDLEIYRSWMYVQNAQNTMEGTDGRAWGRLAYEFIDHVNNGLSRSRFHLYSAYRP
jgi:hypothetical protein